MKKMLETIIENTNNTVSMSYMDAVEAAIGWIDQHFNGDGSIRHTMEDIVHRLAEADWDDATVDSTTVRTVAQGCIFYRAHDTIECLLPDIVQALGLECLDTPTEEVLLVRFYDRSEEGIRWGRYTRPKK